MSIIDRCNTMRSLPRIVGISLLALFTSAPAFADTPRSIKIGDRVLLVASHCDPTVNLYDSYWVCRGERVVAQWPVTGRGMSQ